MASPQQGQLSGGPLAKPRRRSWILLSLLAAFLLRGDSGSALTWYVATAGNDSPHTGTNGWGNAFLTIGKALSLAGTGDAIWVSNGTYAIASQLSLTNAVTLLGVSGWSNTVVDGGGATRCFYIANASAILDGFTVTNGFAWALSSPGNLGGGIYMTAGTVRNCRITRNATGGASYPDGGGVWMSGGIVQDSTICWNSNAGMWTRGGGVMMNGNGLVERCAIFGNSAGSGSGGGVSLNQAGDTVRNCLIAGNSSDDTSGLMGGGGIGMDGGSVENCTIVRNRGIGINRRNGGTVRNSVVWFNVDSAGNPRNWRNFNSGSATYGCATPRPLPTTGDNIEVDPDFADPGSGYGPSATIGDYQPRFGSPLIDAGTNVVTVTNDLDRVPRPYDSAGLVPGPARPDIGAYEVNPAAGVFQCGFNPVSTNGIDSLTAVFTACVAGDPAVTGAVWYGWDFGVGQTPQNGADKRVATNTYGRGQYTVTLTASNSLGAVTNSTRVSCVRVVGATSLVWTAGAHVYPFDSWANAATNIQAAVDAAEAAFDAGATNAATVLVTNGTYSATSRIAVCRGILIRSVNGRDVTTVRRASGSIRGFYINHAQAVLDGFTVSGFSSVNDAGGMFDDSGPNGGAVLMPQGTVQNCILRGNAAADGAGLYANAGTILSCLMESNSAGVAGAGVEGYTCSILYSTFRYNSEPSWGGSGVLLRGAGLIRNCLFYGNVSSGGNAYGPVFLDGGTLESCTIVGNQKGGVFLRSGGLVRNCIIYGNSVTNFYDQSGGRISFTCMTPLPTGGSGNLAVDPQIADAGSGYGLGYVLGNFLLRGSSPCVNAGTNQNWMTNAVDMNGTTRILRGVVDLGAYELSRPAVTNGPAGAITYSSVTLQGDLVSTGDAPATASVFWGPADGGSNRTAWAFTNDFGIRVEGPLATNVSVASNAFYYYRCYVTNSYGENWADPATVVMCGEVTMEATDASASEEGPDGGLFTVSRPATATNVALTVNLVISGTASNGTDYATISNRATFAPGAASVVIPVSPVPDALNEGMESVIVTIAAGNYAVGAANSATVTISDAFAGPWFVATNGSDADTGMSWASAFRTISNALAHATIPGQTVLVSNGVYMLAAPVNLTNGIALVGVGGWSNTVLDGNATTRCVNIGHAAAVLDGFVISNGLAWGGGSPANNGGGLYLTAGTAQNCRVVLNRTGGGGYPDGAGVWMSGGTLQDSAICWNSNAGGWTRGGGVMMNGNGLVQRCVIWGNTTGSGAGGGVSLNQAGDRVRNCLIMGNSAPDTSELLGGGGVGMDGGWVENCTIVRNRGIGANRRGGGTLRNCIVYFNADSSGRTGNHRGFNSGNLVYSCTTPKPLPDTADDLDADPEFLDAGSGSGPSFVAGDYHLRYGSLAIDAGTTLAAIADDLEGRSRPVNGRGGYGSGAAFDMGAYEAEAYTTGVFRCAIAPTLTNGLDALSAVFAASVAGDAANTNVVWYGWDFGLGQTPQSGAGKAVVTNVYAAPGRYTVTLTASNSLGQTASDFRTNMVAVVRRTAYAATNGGSVFPYDTWANAATNSQDAVDVACLAYDAGAATSAAVIVTDGVYRLSQQIQIGRGITFRSVNGRDVTEIRQQTNVNARGFYITAAGAVVDGFTIRGFTPVTTGAGGPDDPAQPHGAAVLIPSTGTGGSVVNCLIVGNTNGAVTGYGAVYIRRGSMVNCIVERNQAWSDVLSVGDAVVSNCIVRYNSNVAWGGAGCTMRTTGAVLRNCLFYGNESTLAAAWGTIFADGGLLESCTLSGNANGGLYVRNAVGSTTIRNCIIWDNSYSNHNAAVLEFTCTTPKPLGQGNLNADPLFKVAGSGYGLALVAGHYDLKSQSPARNAGTNQAWMVNAVDLAGRSRISRFIVDLGAYETLSAPGTLFMVR